MINRILDIISNYVDTPKESYNEDSNVFDLGVDSLRMLRMKNMIIADCCQQIFC